MIEGFAATNRGANILAVRDNGETEFAGSGVWLATVRRIILAHGVKSRSKAHRAGDSVGSSRGACYPRRMHRRHSLVLLLLTACTSNDATPQPDAGHDAGVDAAPSCSITPILTATGTIVDEAGAPVEGALAQFCVELESGATSCIMPTPTDATGVFHVEVPEAVTCIAEGAMRVFFPDGMHADTFAHVDVNTPTAGALTWSEPLVVYATHAPVSLPEYGDGDAMRLVDFGDGLTIEVVPSALPIMRNYNELSARRIPLESPPVFLHDTPTLLGLYAFTSATILDAQFKIHIANDTHLAAGTTVDLYALGGIYTVFADGTQLREANFEQFGTATVSADGSEIVSDDGSGLPFFSWLGYRAHE